MMIDSSNINDDDDDHLLVKRLPRLAVFSTFFYPKLCSGYAGVRRWSRNLKLFEQDLVLVPIHDRGMHWCLAVSWTIYFEPIEI